MSRQMSVTRASGSRYSTPDLDLAEAQERDEGRILLTPGLDPIYQQISLVAAARLPVLIIGETGVGKEHLAELIHRRSNRARHPFVRINCAAISGPLFESELFGHERGAFTGAERAKQGWLEAAAEGTVFLDEIGELTCDFQVKLLRALECGAVPRVGGLETRPIRARFVAATNRDLEQAVEQGTFRRDLYHRIAGLRLTVPPLRERPSDILALAEHFVRTSCREPGRSPVVLSDSVRAALLRHPWTGNVRELRNVLELAVLFAQDGVMAEEHLRLVPSPRPEDGPPPAPLAPGEPIALPRSATPPEVPEWLGLGARRQITREHVLGALAACGGNQTLAAARLNVGRRTLSRWLDGLQIPRPRKRPGLVNEGPLCAPVSAVDSLHEAPAGVRRSAG